MFTNLFWRTAPEEAVSRLLHVKNQPVKDQPAKPQPATAQPVTGQPATSNQRTSHAAVKANNHPSVEVHGPGSLGTPPERLAGPILRRVAIHDRYQLELKLGYPLQPDTPTRYRIDTYIFAPQSLAINAQSYARADFYADIQTYVRMKTPRLTLKRLLDDSNSPLLRCERLIAAAGAANALALDPATEAALDDSLRILRAVFKSALQHTLAPLLRGPQQDAEGCDVAYMRRVDSLLSETAAITQRLRAMQGGLLAAHAGEALLATYRLGDESISLLVEEVLLHALRLADLWLDGPPAVSWRRRLAEAIGAEIDYRHSQGYPSVLRDAAHPGGLSDEDYLLRLSALKKFTSSVLWLNTDTRREGAGLEQLLMASAAGVSMIFATVIAFYVQSIYGFASLPLFVALVVAYMFKDRMKELGKAVGSALLSRHSFDYRTTIRTSDGRCKLGYVREKMTHVKPEEVAHKVPPEVLAARRAGPYTAREFAGLPESVMHYVKEVNLRKDAAKYLAVGGLDISAINDITRLDIRHFLRKMDNPFEERPALVNGCVEMIRCRRVYHLNLISQFGRRAPGGASSASSASSATADPAGGKTVDGKTVERTLIVLGRKGIHRIEQYDAAGGQAHRVAGPSEAEDDTAGEIIQES